MKVVFHKKFQRFVRRIKDKVLLEKIAFEIDLIIKKPKSGKLLDHPFRKYMIYSVNFVYKKNSYRIAYTKSYESDKLLFLLIDSRENFYEKLLRIAK